MIDKIIDLIFEEARRRPGRDFVSNLYAVMAALSIRLGQTMSILRELERQGEADKRSEKGAPGDT